MFFKVISLQLQEDFHIHQRNPCPKTNYMFGYRGGEKERKQLFNDISASGCNGSNTHFQPYTQTKSKINDCNYTPSLIFRK